MDAPAPAAARLKPATPSQALLLRAAVLPGPAALAPWEEWQRTACVDHLEQDSQWLLPLVYWNLRHAGVAEARLLRYAYVYRHNWYKNHLLLRTARSALQALRDAGHAPLVLRGAAVAAAHYPALGARPIEALVVWAPGLAGAAAADWLRGAGWQINGAPAHHEAVTFIGAGGFCLRLEPLAFGPQGYRGVLTRAQRVNVRGTAFDVMGTPDQLLHAVIQRAAWDRRSALLWAADAVQIMRRLGQPGRAAVWHLARGLGMEDALVDALDQLREDFGIVSSLLHG